MKVTKKKQQTIIQFDSQIELPGDDQKKQQKDLLDKFLQPSPYFKFPQIVKPKQIQQPRKKFIAFAIYYGIKNQKTTSVFLNFLEKTRQIATNYLKDKKYLKAATFYADCLAFKDPDDQIFLQKFTIIKIDIVNKLIFCIFQMERSQKLENRQDSKHVDSAYIFMQIFLQQCKQYPFYNNLQKNQNCLLQLNYFFLGKLYKRKKNFIKSKQQYYKVLQIIQLKLNNKLLISKNQQIINFLNNLKIKTNYKISKCFRQENDQQQSKLYSQIALKIAKQYNRALYLYINKKMRFYQKKKVFKMILTKLDGKKRLQEEVIKLIQQSKVNQIQSLYDVYLDECQ